MPCDFGASRSVLVSNCWPFVWNYSSSDSELLFGKRCWIWGFVVQSTLYCIRKIYEIKERLSKNTLKINSKTTGLIDVVINFATYNSVWKKYRKRELGTKILSKQLSSFVSWTIFNNRLFLQSRCKRNDACVRACICVLPSVGACVRTCLMDVCVRAAWVVRCGRVRVWGACAACTVRVWCVGACVCVYACVRAEMKNWAGRHSRERNSKQNWIRCAL